MGWSSSQLRESNRPQLRWLDGSEQFQLQLPSFGRKQGKLTHDWNEPCTGLLADMVQYHYDILGDVPFRDEEGAYHLDDDSAWREAMRLVRDVEANLSPGGRWALTVREGDKLVFFIEVTAKLGNRRNLRLPTL
jgi:hypothetical protein